MESAVNYIGGVSGTGYGVRRYRLGAAMAKWVGRDDKVYSLILTDAGGNEAVLNGLTYQQMDELEHAWLSVQRAKLR